MTIAVVVAALALACANGANDNFKGVATLFGSGALSYRAALAWATIATLAGSLAAVALAASLVKVFSGRAIVSHAVAASPAFLAAVAVGAAAAVLGASRIGMPVSTTHALLGALVGAGAAATGGDLHVHALFGRLVLPLLFSPLVAVALTLALYPVASGLRRALGVERTSCVCAGAPATLAAGGAAALTNELAVWTGHAPECVARYEGRVAGVSAQRAFDVLHVLSAGAMSFARGLNDTPKMVGVMIAGGALGAGSSAASVGLAIAAGGWLGARRVAETVSRRITDVPPGQGLVANLVTAGLVVLATPMGWPVSTTHVAAGSLVGVGVLSKTARWRTIGAIAAAWVTTLPAAALLGALAYVVLVRA